MVEVTVMPDRHKHGKELGAVVPPTISLRKLP